MRVRCTMCVRYAAGGDARGAECLPLLLQTLDDHGLHGHQKAAEAGVGGFEFAFVGGGAPVVVEQPPETKRRSGTPRSRRPTSTPAWS
jgi:hypothetical protein